MRICRATRLGPLTHRVYRMRLMCSRRATRTRAALSMHTRPAPAVSGATRCHSQALPHNPNPTELHPARSITATAYRSRPPYPLINLPCITIPALFQDRHQPGATQPRATPTQPLLQDRRYLSATLHDPLRTVHDPRNTVVRPARSGAVEVAGDWSRGGAVDRLVTRNCPCQQRLSRWTRCDPSSATG